MKLSDINLNRIKKLISSAAGESEKIATEVKNLLEKLDKEFFDYLESSEKMLLNVLEGKQPTTVSTGRLQHGAFRYLLKIAIDELIDKKMLSGVELTVAEALKIVIGLEAIVITDEVWKKYEKLVQETGGYVGEDGTIYGFNKYEQLDWEWAVAGLYYVFTLVGVLKKAEFVKQTNDKGIQVTQDVVKIAVVGDWGTGPYKNADGVEASTLVMKNLASHNPDYTIHLGDTYYAGTSKEDDVFNNEEIDNLINVWNSGSDNNFALNSNHEMYSGGVGLFHEALNAKFTSKFTLQNGASYFALVHEKWVIFGLDSAYYDQSWLIMDGALTDYDQINFMKGIDVTNKKVIVMTHHNALKNPGTTRLPLWDDMNKALGNKDPDFWYWGHLHNGIAYTSEANANKAIVRCIGHGGIPFAKATGLYQDDGSKTGANNKEIAYYSGENLPIQKGVMHKLAPNGFGILTISGKSLKEEFFNQDGKSEWSQTHDF